jgi:ribulose 1,5-bisphosphate synthetase/thiazole synthase
LGWQTAFAGWKTLVNLTVANEAEEALLLTWSAKGLSCNIDGMHAVIVGAGIGGLAAAVALRQVGFDVTVTERAAEIREVGAGLFHLGQCGTPKFCASFRSAF